MVIIGYEKEKAEIEGLKKMLHKFDDYKNSGVRIPRGLLLWGESGVGKTALAHSIAEEGINLIELKVALCCDDEISSTIEEAFENARKSAPSVLLLDELDKLAGADDSFNPGNNDRIRKILLAELDGLSDSDRVLVVATCNDGESLGDALIRPGRFDRIIKIDLPDEETRKKILEEYFSRIKADRNFNIADLVRNTRGFSGAKLECLANEAGILALQKDVYTIDEDDIRYVLNKMEFGALEKNPFKDYKELHRVAIHEAGHALVGMLLCPNNIFGASIMPQGKSNGHIRFVPDGLTQSVSEIEKEVAVMLAGHIAERYAFNEYMLGSRSDIHNAMIRIHYLATKEAAYGYKYCMDGFRRERLSESTQLKLESFINEKLSEIDKSVEHLIRNNASLYNGIVAALEEKFVLSSDELKCLMSESSYKNAA